MKIGDSVTKIGYGVFEGCSSLTSVEFGKSVQEIGRHLVRNCTALKTLRILNPIPPKISGYTFEEEQYKTLKIFVPQQGLSKYRATEEWGKFQNLQGFDPK